MKLLIYSLNIDLVSKNFGSFRMRHAIIAPEFPKRLEDENFAPKCIILFLLYKGIIRLKRAKTIHSSLSETRRFLFFRYQGSKLFLLIVTSQSNLDSHRESTFGNTGCQFRGNIQNDEQVLLHSTERS